MYTYKFNYSKNANDKMLLYKACTSWYGLSSAAYFLQYKHTFKVPQLKIIHPSHSLRIKGNKNVSLIGAARIHWALTLGQVDIIFPGLQFRELRQRKIK
jgi:hypothetical protein